MVRRFVASGEGRFVSFDIFDTLLTRIWLHPRDPFLVTARILRERGLTALSEEDWARARIRAEAAVRRDHGELEILHADIYEALAETLGWSETERDAARLVEIDVELSSVRPIGETVSAWAEHVESGGKAALISDMYLDSEVVRRMIESRAIPLAGNRLFVSSEHGLRKQTGRLYEHVVAECGLGEGERRHVGDNPVSDIERARAAGFEALHYRGAEPNRYESALHSRRIGDRAARSAFAGAARAARLAGAEVDPHARILRRISADIAAPLLFSFVLWALKDAIEKGLDRLFFVARDGQILLKIAERICEAWSLPIQCAYLHGSRQGWHLPGLTEIGDFERGWITEQFTRHTLREILDRAGIAPEDVAEAVERSGFERRRWDETLGFHDRKRLDALLSDPQTATAILAAAAERREIGLDYFRDAGLMDAKRPGLVDIGWRGRLQRSLCRSMQTIAPEFHERLHGFYLGLTENPPYEEAGRYAAFRRTNSRNVIGAAHYGIWALVEVFTTADHGSLRAFERDEEGRARPVLLETGFQEAVEWGVPLQQAAILDFTEVFIAAARLAEVRIFEQSDGLGRAAMAAFDRFAETPSREEAEVYGRYPEFGDQRHKRRVSLAGRASGLKLPLFLAAPEAFIKSGPWRPGVAARSAPRGLAPLATRLLRWRRLVTEPTGLRPLASAVVKTLLAWRRRLTGG
jgi:predicted HAD superfamily hydrolase